MAWCYRLLGIPAIWFIDALLAFDNWRSKRYDRLNPPDDDTEDTEEDP